MADPRFLDEFIASQTDDPLSRRLVEIYRDMVRGHDVVVSDYPARLRQAMDRIFEEDINALSRPDGS
jgi:hypothetical protein